MRKCPLLGDFYLRAAEMKLNVKIQLLKFCSAVLSSVFLALGVSVAGCAVWMLFDTGSFMSVISSEELQTVGASLLLIGGVVVLVGLLGCLGIQTGNRPLLLMYFGLLLVLLLGQMFVTLLLLINKQKIGGSLDEAVNQMLLHYGDGDKHGDMLMDKLQRYGRCCGVTDASDWLENSFIKTLNLTSPDLLPSSCFTSCHPAVTWCSKHDLPMPPFGQGSNSSSKGCSKQLTDWLDENILTIAGMDVSLMLIQVLQSLLAISLFRCFGQKAALKRSHQLVAADSAHLDHALPDDSGEQNLAYMDSGDFGSAHLDHALPDDSGEQNLAYMDSGDFGPAHPSFYHGDHSGHHQQNLWYQEAVLRVQ